MEPDGFELSCVVIVCFVEFAVVDDVVSFVAFRQSAALNIGSSLTLKLSVKPYFRFFWVYTLITRVTAPPTEILPDFDETSPKFSYQPDLPGPDRIFAAGWPAIERRSGRVETRPVD